MPLHLNLLLFIKKRYHVKNSLFVMFSLIPFICFSQQILDTANLKCHYQYIWLNDTLEGKERDDLLILQIGNNISKCYSHYSNQVDSINASPDGNRKIGKMIDNAIKSGEFFKGNYPHKRLKAYIYKNYPEGEMTVTDGLSLQDYVYEDDLHSQDWEIMDSLKVILDYQCQKAICYFRGREWTAWFSPDIPVSDGPWKFSGLPGLIMEAYDNGKKHHFNIIGLEKTEEPIIFSETYVGSRKFDKTNRIEFLKAQKRYLMNINGYIEMETGIDLSGGQPAKIMRYDLIEKDYR